MRSTAPLLSAAALAGLAAANPAPQQLDMGAIFNAPSVTATGPPLASLSQVIDINTASIQASISTAVTKVATASITGAAASNAANMAAPSNSPSKRSVHQKRSLLSQLLSMWGAKINTGSSGSSNAATTSSSSSAAPTSTSKSATSSPAANANYFTSMPLTSTTSTATSGSGTSSTSSSTTACPTTPEDGTYCGFINPEDPCAPQPDGYGPKVTPDTTDNFLAYPDFHKTAQNAATPKGYLRTFVDLDASSSANSYMGLHTLTSYSPSDCAAWCDNTTSCTSFNIYIERDPSQNPCQNDSTDPTVWGYWCPQPSSITNYKCTLWGSDLDATTALNQGGWRGQFNVVVTGSNGYSKTNITTPPTVDQYTPPSNCSGKAINGGAYWLGSKFFSGIFDPKLCATYANTVTSYNKQAAISANKNSYTPCQMFNAYHVYKNNLPQGTYCSLYNTQLSSSWATYSGSYSGRDYFSVRNSWQYQLSKPDSGRC